MKYVIVMSEAFRREVIHLTENDEKTLCGRPVEAEWQVLENLDGYPNTNVMHCQGCKREQDKKNEPPKQQPKKTRMYLGHPI